ncbi:pentatricopeptide repeat-containing protein At4g18975, chloroplastic-like [Rutidosis leptorrhynchoides]|uniref:pentatricopeptide repeat-containing protein At4g18975, chloroplastic-like n=1 Tax=Rutidosis leptorrhynchoides TaxID=125765 RepID=UPI003A9966BC
MLASKVFNRLINPMRCQGILRVPIASYSQTTIIQDLIPTPVNEDRYLQDQFNKQVVVQCMEKDIEERKLQKEYNVFKKDKIGFLVSMLIELDDSKESVYGALDVWVAEEREFPIGRLKTALISLEKMEKWHKVVQVIKWMLSKGQGVTIGTYGQLIRALDMDNRVKEANKIWVKKLSRDVQLVPWKVMDIIITVYHRNEMWEELVKLFKGLEARGRKPPDRSVVRKVAESYEKLGLVEEKERFLEKYKSFFSKTRGRYGRKVSKELSTSAVLKISS